MAQVLHHLDKLYLGSGAMLLFKYPLLNRKLMELMPAIKDEIEAENEGQINAGASDYEVRERAMARIFENPISEDIENLECEDYTD